MNKQAFIQGYKLEKQAIEWGQALTNALPSAGLGAAIGGIPFAIYGGLTAKKDESPWWRAAKFGLGGAGLGGLAGGGYGVYENINKRREIERAKLKIEEAEAFDRAKNRDLIKEQKEDISSYEKLLNDIDIAKKNKDEEYFNDPVYEFVQEILSKASDEEREQLMNKTRAWWFINPHISRTSNMPYGGVRFPSSKGD